MEVIDRSIFWDIGRTLTYNRLLNIIIGNRGGGKSYGAKKRAIEQFIKKGEQFGYIRRYKDDLKEPMLQFFQDIMWEFEEYEFKTEGTKFYIRLKPSNEKEKWTEKDVAGYGFALSTANNKKSIAYPKITTLIFDEFLIEKGNQRYLSKEPEKLLSLYETIARPGTGHPRVVMFLLANAISITNPYFLYWDLRISNEKDKNNKYIWVHPNKPILVEDVRNDDFINIKKSTEFGQLVEGTNYADYSIENKFLLDDDSFVEKKSPSAKLEFNFSYMGETFGVWYSYGEGKMWVSKSYDPYRGTFAFTLKDHTPNTMLLRTRQKGTIFRTFIEAFKSGNVYFESINIKNITYEVIKMLLY